jgi:hypothetical protein
MENLVAALLIGLGGCFSIVCSIGDFDWFINNRKAQSVVKLIGRNGTRIFYGLLGAALVVLAILLATGLLKSK